MDVSAEKPTKPKRSADAIIALLSTIAFIRSGLLSEVLIPSALRESVLSYDSTSGSRSWEQGQPELGACILDACAEKPNARLKRKQAVGPRLSGRRLASGSDGCPAAPAGKTGQKMTV